MPLYMADMKLPFFFLPHSQPKTLDEALRADPPCYPRAVGHPSFLFLLASTHAYTRALLTNPNLVLPFQCAIQSCLQKSNHDESRCAHLIDALYECCAELYKREGPGAKSTCCPKESLLKLKLKQKQDAGGFGGAAELHETRRR